MLDEFKRFVLGGNMVDMAVGIVIGAAFGTIVGSLVEDIVLPPIGLLFSVRYSPCLKKVLPLHPMQH